MPWGVAAGVVGSVASSAISGAISGGSGGASSAASAADPFAGQRAQYQTQLANLMNNPSSITSTPGYQFQEQQGLDAVNGAMSSAGYLNSGNRLTALNQEGQNFASTQLQNQELFLAQLSGANVGSPGEAGSILQSQNALNQQAAGTAGSAIGQGISSAISGFNTGSSSGGYNFTMPSSYNSGSYGVNSSNNYGFTSGVGDSSSYIPGTYGV